MAVTDPAGTNADLLARTANFAVGNEVEQIGRPHLDLFHQGLAIPGNCSIKLRFIPNPNALIRGESGESFGFP